MPAHGAQVYLTLLALVLLCAAWRVARPCVRVAGVRYAILGLATAVGAYVYVCFLVADWDHAAYFRNFACPTATSMPDCFGI